MKFMFMNEPKHVHTHLISAGVIPFMENPGPRYSATEDVIINLI